MDLNQNVKIGSKVTPKSPQEVKLSRMYYLKNTFLLLIETIIVLSTEIFKSALSYFKKVENKDISGQVALVTGGGNGLGKEICIQLATSGCNIAIADVDLNGAIETAKYITEEFKVKAKAYKVDVSNYEEVQNLKVQIEEDIGPVDILVNNAGLMPTKSTLRDSTKEEVEKVIGVNLTAHFWTLQAFLGSMKTRKRGHIVSISSMAGYMAVPIALSYTATKFAVRGLMEGLKMELAMTNRDFIKTTSVHPYFIRTNPDLIEYLDKNDILRHYPALTPTYVAKQVLDGILKNRTTVIIPEWYILLGYFSKMLPDAAFKRVSRNFLIAKNMNKSMAKSD